MKQPVFTGSCTALATPFTDSNAIDYPALHRLLDFQLENGTMWAELFSGITISMLIPCLILIPFQKYYIRGIGSSGMKD